MADFIIPIEDPGASGPPPQPINDTFFNRTLTFFALRISGKGLLGRFWRQSERLVVVWKYAIKVGASSLAEAHTMKFVAENTSIPVPKVYCAFTHDKQVYIVMERIYGEDAACHWTHRPEGSKARILVQLKGFIQQLRDIPPPPPSNDQYAVSNVIGGPIFDEHKQKLQPRGPFRTIDDFHNELRDGLELNKDNSALIPEDLGELVKFHHQPFSKVVFTHGDLSSVNIMVDDDDVVGIVDWETAGWFPPYWEYVKAWNVDAQNAFWQDEVDKFLEPLLHERKMEVVRRKYFEPFSTRLLS
ncbi:hypothetical protein ONZ43_g7187 [Nemania bipapillata]|uniref:Uncharacterized protein n=1 Tax=Nemania bipapillata TaxID=110536 RepID=A0ACC2HSK6_9PEZI|nr:hypothetical protein ONZ43_g7187 [Nemania bipapillata]